MKKNFLISAEILSLILSVICYTGYLPIYWLTIFFAIFLIVLCYSYHQLLYNYNDLEKSHIERSDQLSKRGLQLQERQQKLQAIDQEYHLLQQTYQTALQQIESAKQDYEKLQEECLHLQDTTKNELAKKNQSEQKLREEYQILQEKHLQDHATFTKKFQDINQSYFALEANRNQLQEEYTTLQQNHKQLLEKDAELQHNLAELRQQYNQIQSELNTTLEKQKQLMSAHSELTEKGQKLSQENNDLLGQTQKLQLKIKDNNNKEDEWLQQQQQWLERDLIAQQKIQELECTIEMLRHPPVILQEFIQETKLFMSEFETKLQLLHQGTINRGILQELSQYIERVKNKSQILSLNSLLPQTEKIYTLLQILRNAQGIFRLEQMVEMHQETQRLIEMLQQYHAIGSKIVAAKPTLPIVEEPKLETKPSSSISPLFVYRVYCCLRRAVLCAGSYPMEIVRFIRQLDDLWQNLLPQQKQLDNRHVFALDDLVERALQNLRPNLQQRNVTLHVEKELSLLLLYGDTCKITNLLVMFLTASVWRAEPTSGLKFLWTLEQEPGGASVKLSTAVTIRSTEPQILEKLAQWRQYVQPHCRECNAYLSTDKWGFTLELPGVLNLLFPENLQLGWWGKLAEVETNLNAIARFFPMRWQLINQDNLTTALSQNSLAGLLIEAPYWTAWLDYWKSLGNATPALPLVAIIGKLESDVCTSNEFQIINDEFSLPLNPSDLKWFLMRCLDIWTRQHLTNYMA